jgi:hypothetical protein
MRLWNTLKRLRQHIGAQRRTRPKQKTWLEIESLEERTVPTAAWSPTTALPNGDTADNMLLLTDGSVMVHGHTGNSPRIVWVTTPGARAPTYTGERSSP